MTTGVLKQTDDGWLLSPPGLHTMEERARFLPFLLLVGWYLVALIELDIPSGDTSHALALGVAFAVAVPWNIWLTKLGPGRRALFAADKVTLLIRDPWAKTIREEELEKPRITIELLTLKASETEFLRELKVVLADWSVTYKISAPMRLEDAEEFIRYLEVSGYRTVVGEGSAFTTKR